MRLQYASPSALRREECDFSSLIGREGDSNISQYIHAAKFLSNSSFLASYIDLISVTMTFSSSIFSGCICMPFCTGGLINFPRSTGGKNHLDQSQWIVIVVTES